MEFVGLGGEIPQRPALARYWLAMRSRRSFAAADIWTKIHPLRMIAGILGFEKEPWHRPVSPPSAFAGCAGPAT
jgi:hypothetical protein